MSGTLQLLACASYVSLFGKNVNIVNENSMKTHALLFSSTEAGLDVNAQKLGAVELGYDIVKGTESILLLKISVILNWCCSKRGVWQK